MKFFYLKNGVNLDGDLIEPLDELLQKKSESKELDEATKIKVVDDFITSEFDSAEQAVQSFPKLDNPDALRQNPIADRPYKSILMHQHLAEMSKLKEKTKENWCAPVSVPYFKIMFGCFCAFNTFNTLKVLFIPRL
jgi:hypothetical protein